MSNALTTIQNLVGRDSRLRHAGTELSLNTTGRILDLIVKHRETLLDPAVRTWVVARSSENDYWIVDTALRLAQTALDEGFHEDALQVLDNVVATLTGGDLHELGKHDYMKVRSLEPLVLSPGAVSRYPDTWGRRLVELQAAALYGAQQADWPQRRDFMSEWAERSGEAISIPNAFAPDYDDSADIRYYESPIRRHGIQGALATAIGNGLSESLTFPSVDTFHSLAQRLIESRWSLAICQVLVSLYDAVQQGADAREWHIPETIALLSDARCETAMAARHFRRLLRREIGDKLDEGARRRLVACIREHSPTPNIRLSELADLESWGLLTTDEFKNIAAGRENHTMGDPRDPRDMRRASTVTWARAGPNKEEFADQWPHGADKPHWKCFWQFQVPGSDADDSTLQQWIAQHAPALETILRRPEAREERWFGQIMEWCAGLIGTLRRALVSRSVERLLKAPAYIAELEAKAPWWSAIAQAALERLRRDVPADHRDQASEPLGWSSNDHIYVSLQYLDELLAIEGSGPIDELRAQLGLTIANQWDVWPEFTRATALAMLRPFHWLATAHLRSLLDRITGIDTSAGIIERAFGHLLRSGSPIVVDVLKRTWERVSSISDPPRIGRLIGQVLGNALIRCRGDLDNDPSLHSLATWLDSLRGHEEEPSSAWSALVIGAVWAMRERLSEIDQLTELHAQAWLPFARWAVEERLRVQGLDSEHGSVIRSVTAVLEMNWPSAIRSQLYEQLADLLERIILECDVDEFCMLHVDLMSELRQDDIVSNRSEKRPSRPIAPSDTILLQLSRASAERVVQWRKANERTRDLAYGRCLGGVDTAELIGAVFSYARDRELVRRELPPIVDALAAASPPQLVAELRLRLRQP